LYKEEKKYEEYAWVLDYLPHGRPGIPRSSHGTTGVIQLIGERYFTLLEAAAEANMDYNIGDRIFVGKGERARVSHILGRIKYEDLTSAAKAEIPLVIEKIIEENEKGFLDFINNSQPVTPRMHSLELIPGIGKRLMFQILEQRERRTFSSFEDLQNRVNLTNIKQLIARRIIQELEEEEKYNLFARPT
jgi:putative nucleotide binding protein